MRSMYDRCLLPPGFKLVCFLLGMLILEAEHATMSAWPHHQAVS